MISGMLFLFLISLAGIVIWIKTAGKVKNTETDLTEPGNSIYETSFIDNRLETSSIKVISQEISQDKMIFYLEDKTELCIPSADLIYEDNGMVYEDSEKRIEFREGMAFISKTEMDFELESFSQMSRKKKGE